MVGQSVMWVTVTVSLLGSPPCLWKLGEGSSSLNHPLNHCPVHQSYTGGSRLSRTAVKPDSRFAWIFVAKFLCIIKLIIING